MDYDRWSQAVVEWASLGPADEPLVWPSAEELTVIISGLRRVLAQAPPHGDDVLSDSLVLMAGAIAEGLVQVSGAPAGYLTAVARNRLRDEMRREARQKALQGRAESFAGAANEPDISDQVIRALGDEQVLNEALARADRATRRVAAAFLDLSAELGDRPTAEVVAQVAGYSRKTVFAAYVRLADLVEDVLTGSGEPDP